MFHFIEKTIAERVSEHVRARYGVETPGQSRTTQAVLFRRTRDPGRVSTRAPIAAGAQGDRDPACGGDLSGLKASRAFEVAGNGFINVRLDRARYGDGGAARRHGARASSRPAKIIVEHTNINPNKAAHIGHLRNAVLGDTFVRMLRAIGHTGRSAELHRQYRRAGGRCRGRASSISNR